MRVAKQHDSFPAAVLEVLAPESPERAPWRVVDDEARIEPNKVTGLAKAPVEFIILIAHEGLVVTPDLIERSATERAEVEVALGNANAEAKKILASATSRAEARERDIVENAKKEAEAMIVKAKADIDGEREKAVAQIRSEVVDLSMKAATEVLGRAVGADDDRRLAEEIVSASGN